MKPAYLICAILAVFAAASGQEKIKHANTKPATPVSNAPVTQSESAAVFEQLRNVMAETLLTPTLRKVAGTAAGSGAVSRDDVVLALDRLADAAKPQFKLSLPPALVEPTALNTKQPRVKEAMIRLTRGGFTNRVGVLLCGPGDTIDPENFGDAIGFFLARIAELTHTPSVKWSPYLQPPS